MGLMIFVGVDRTATVGILAVVLLLGGCTGVVDTPGSAPPETTAGSPVTETTATPGNSSTTAGPSSVVDYRALTDRQQSAFRAALEGSARFVPNSSFIDESAGYDPDTGTPFRSHDHVRYDGDLYRIHLQRGNLYATYTIRASVGEPPGNASVVAFADLPAAIRDEVRTALTDGKYNAPMGKWHSLPDVLQTTAYVRYENRTYSLTYTVGDAWATVLTVEKVQ